MHLKSWHFFDLQQIRAQIPADKMPLQQKSVHGSKLIIESCTSAYFFKCFGISFWKRLLRHKGWFLKIVFCWEFYPFGKQNILVKMTMACIIKPLSKSRVCKSNKTSNKGKSGVASRWIFILNLSKASKENWIRPALRRGYLISKWERTL